MWSRGYWIRVWMRIMLILDSLLPFDLRCKPVFFCRKRNISSCDLTIAKKKADLLLFEFWQHLAGIYLKSWETKYLVS